MLLKELVTCKHYKFADEAESWRDAIRMSCAPLEADGSVTADYKEEIIRAVERYGPYIIIMPNVAIPHAQECTDSVRKTAVSFMKLRKPVCFTEDGHKEYCVQNFFTFASCDTDKHISNLSSLMKLLMNQEFIKEFDQIMCEQDLKILQKKMGGAKLKGIQDKGGCRVLVCCANGMASGQILKMSLEKIFENLGITVESITHCMLSEVEAYADSCNMVVCSAHFMHTLSYIQEKGIPVIGIQNIMSLQEMEEKISTVLKEGFI